jgi:hypothetical protein
MSSIYSKVFIEIPAAIARGIFLVSNESPHVMQSSYSFPKKYCVAISRSQTELLKKRPQTATCCLVVPVSWLCFSSWTATGLPLSRPFMCASSSIYGKIFFIRERFCTAPS